MCIYFAVQRAVIWCNKECNVMYTEECLNYVHVVLERLDQAIYTYLGVPVFQFESAFEY